MSSPANPLLLQVNTRVRLTELSRRFNRAATLDDIPDAYLDRYAAAGFDWLWFLSVWQTGEAARRISLTNPEWRSEFEHTLPDLRDDDIGGSGFAITDYKVHAAMGGNPALARLRQRMRQRGLRLMLDFVPNHMGLGHPWVDDHPDFFVQGTEVDLAQAPRNYVRVKSKGTDMLLAHGRDPYFPGWPDTLQIDYGNPLAQEAMRGELLRIASQCDGVRCDMAMLVLPDVFERTWGIRSRPFWPDAIRCVREGHPGFVFMAEVYWDLEWTMHQQGFDYAYDKRLYDRLRDRHARPVREHLCAGIDYQKRLARFLENHDEPRAAAVFPPEMHEAAAIVTFMSPGLKFVHEGQSEGFVKRISPHLVRGPGEPVNAGAQAFYGRLFQALRRRELREDWQMLSCDSAWPGNLSSDAFLAWIWTGAGGGRLLVCLNYSGSSAQCYVRIPGPELAGATWRLRDLMGDVCYDRPGDELTGKGLYLDVGPWEYHVFDLQKSG